MIVEVGAIHLVLNCLSIFTHHNSNIAPAPELIKPTIKPPAVAITDDQIISDDKSHVYWAKGTGFGTGSTQQSWNVEQALLRQKSEEEHVTVLLQVSSRGFFFVCENLFENFFRFFRATSIQATLYLTLKLAIQT
jgi:baculoviral IAP repeat-containing protein 6 (apollon)